MLFCLQCWCHCCNQCCNVGEKDGDRPCGKLKFGKKLGVGGRLGVGGWYMFVLWSNSSELTSIM